MNTLDDQKHCCETYGADWSPAPSDFKVHAARSLLQGTGPFHGARREAGERDSGWYLWVGDVYSDDPEFFMQVSVASLREWCPSILKFLGLPAGYRFELSETGEKAWLDPELLD